jgi:hypothetical protein
MGWVVNATSQPFYLRERAPVSIVEEAVWAPGPVWSCMETVQPVASRYTDYTIPI